MVTINYGPKAHGNIPTAQHVLAPILHKSAFGMGVSNTSCRKTNEIEIY